MAIAGAQKGRSGLLRHTRPDQSDAGAVPGKGSIPGISRTGTDAEGDERVSESSLVAEDVVRLDDLEIDLRSRRARKGGKEINLSVTERRLLTEMARSPGHAMSRDVLLDRVWGYDYLGGSRLVDMAIRRLRAKVEDDPRNPRLIRTVRGVGYRLET